MIRWWEMIAVDAELQNLIAHMDAAFPDERPRGEERCAYYIFLLTERWLAEIPGIRQRLSWRRVNVHEWRIDVEVSGTKRSVHSGSRAVNLLSRFRDDRLGYEKDGAWVTVSMREFQQGIRDLLREEGARPVAAAGPQAKKRGWWPWPKAATADATAAVPRYRPGNTDR